MYPSSYSRCANAMVLFTPKRSRVLAACCKVEVMNGGPGLEDVGLSSRFSTTKCELCKRAHASSACDLSKGRKASLPCVLTSIVNSASSPKITSAVTVQNSSGSYALISLSLSTSIFKATDCTLPADNPRPTFSQSRGETIKPTILSKKRLAC